MGSVTRTDFVRTMCGRQALGYFKTMRSMTQSPPQATVSKVFWSWIGAVIGIALAVSNIPKGRRYPEFWFQRGRALPHWLKRKTRHLQHENKDAAMHTKKSLTVFSGWEPWIVRNTRPSSNRER